MLLYDFFKTAVYAIHLLIVDLFLRLVLNMRNSFYAKYIKRSLDFFVSLISLVVLSPIIIILTAIGFITMKGNPFFLQLRPGKKGRDGKEKIFRLIKFRTMSNKKDEKGNLLHDDLRLNKYGKMLRSTSLDELPELFNIISGGKKRYTRNNLIAVNPISL